MNAHAAGAVVGVDVGGTFTDLFHHDEASGRFRIAKVPSSRGAEAEGFIDGLRKFGPIAELSSVVHGTTVGTNALLERRGARVGLITTRGFRDVLEMRRRDRPKTWGLIGDFVPVIDRDLRLEVAERTLADGTVREPVDVAAVRDAARALLERGAHAVAIAFINAYANPANERAALAAVEEIWPNAHVCCSSAILAEWREFERTSTVALNAYLQPVVGGYLAQLDGALQREEFAGRFHVIQSNGGVMATETARRLPVRTALSGPAAGVIAAAAVACEAGFADAITADLGGTSFDVSLVVDGKPALAAQTAVGFGLVIRTPMIEITTIGAGGGSIARVDAGGLLEVGPESAGARPGPACYAQGNTRPTLTDANLVLGRINAAQPIGGALARFDVDAACVAIETHVARPLGLDVIAAADAIVRVANARMAEAIRLVSIERGHDPGRFVLVPFGGGGALHAGALIREVGLRAALVPRYPGVTSALGCVIADVRHDFVETLNLPLENLDAAALDRRMAESAASAHAVVEAAGLSLNGTDISFELDMHYTGQTHTVAVPLPLLVRGSVTGVNAEIVRDSFERAYRAAFGRLLPGIPPRIVNLRTAAIGRRPHFDFAALSPDRDATVEGARRSSRPVWFGGTKVETAIFARLDLPAGAAIAGPAILEQSDATVVVDPGLTARVDRLGNLILERCA